MNEKPLVTKMREEYKDFGGLSLIYGLIFAFCLYKNMHGITFPICIAVTIVFFYLFMKKINYKLQKKSILYIIGMILLGISTSLTTSFFLHFFNMIGILLLFFGFMISQFYDDSTWTFTSYLSKIFLLGGAIVSSFYMPYSHGIQYLKTDEKNKNKSQMLAIITGVGIAIICLSVIFPLLLKSDVIFSKMFSDLIKSADLINIFGILITIMIGFTCAYAVFGSLCKYDLNKETTRKVKVYNPVIGITFTSMVSLVYVVYSGIQIAYLFMRIESGLPENVTYAEYARSGFWELLFVSIINFIIVLLCNCLFEENIALKITLTIISGCTFIMIFSAAYRMGMYINVYHLTLLRILVIWGLIVIAFIMLGTIVNIYKKKIPLFRFIIFVVSILYICLSFSRPDEIIARYNIEHNQSMNQDDIYYLLYNLSEDAAPYIAGVEFEQVINNDEYFQEKLSDYFEEITNEEITFRKINYSAVRAQKIAKQYLGTR